MKSSESTVKEGRKRGLFGRLMIGVMIGAAVFLAVKALKKRNQTESWHHAYGLPNSFRHRHDIPEENTPEGVEESNHVNGTSATAKSSMTA